MHAWIKQRCKKISKKVFYVLLGMGIRLFLPLGSLPVFFTFKNLSSREIEKITLSFGSVPKCLL